MAFRRVKVKGGRRYVEIVENYWDKKKKAPRQRVIKYLGVEEEKNGKKEIKPASQKMDEIEKSIKIGEMALYYSAIRDIQMSKILKKYFSAEYSAIIALIMNQLHSRKSLEKAANWINNTPMLQWECVEHKEYTRNDLDDALEGLCFIKDGVKNDVGLSIQRELSKNCQEKYSDGCKYLFYDISKITYYGYKCEYSELGYNPEKRGKNAIGLGLVTTIENGFPVRCGAIPGSKNDTITMEDMIFALNNWGYKGMPMIIDRGMMSAKNINMARDNGFHVIGCCPDNRKDVEEAIMKWNDEEISVWDGAIKRPSGEVVYVKGWKGELYGQKGLIVVVLDPKLKAIQKANRDVMIKELKDTTDEDLIKELKKRLKNVTVKSKGRYGFKVDDNLLKKAERKDGRYLMFCTDRRLSAKRVFKTYFQRDEIEKTFKCLKGEISLGPIRYQRPTRIDAYMTIIFLSYMLRAVLRYLLKKNNLKIEVSEAIETLKSISLIEFSYNNKIRRKVSRLTQKQESLVKALKIDELIPSAENR